MSDLSASASSIFNLKDSTWKLREHTNGSSKSSVEDLLPEGRQSLITLIGHTDRLGTEAYNYALGLRRAETVKAYLKSNGVNYPMATSSKG